MPTGPSGKPRLLRGINLGNALDAPTEGQWGVVLDESDFSRVSKEGFDHVRLPVRFAAHAKADPPYAIDGEFFRRVDWAVAQALKNGLAVVVDLHYYDALTKDPESHRARFIGLWRQIAERYRDAPAAVCFELLNEPHDQLTAVEWNSILAETFRVVRASNPSERSSSRGWIGRRPRVSATPSRSPTTQTWSRAFTCTSPFCSPIKAPPG
jgi:endoglucanase